MQLKDKIFNFTELDFEKIALDIFKYQYTRGKIYKAYVDNLEIKPSMVKCIDDIPFLPISFFKTQCITASKEHAVKVFESSGTSGSVNSKHYITNIEIYEKSLLKSFENHFGKADNYCFLALLPSYLERSNSSLIYMVDYLMSKSKNPNNGYYLNNHYELYKKLQEVEISKQPTCLFGVSFALLDFAEKYRLSLNHTKIIETGGMKGRRKEITRSDLHNTLCKAFDVEYISSEYGMTELLSQAYSNGKGEYRCPPWMRVFIREVNDPFTYIDKGAGGINIIDFSNIYSCSFIETQDLGCINDNNTFSLLGRFDVSDVRGCNLMVAEK